MTKQLRTYEDGSASHWTMTRKEFFKLHKDFRNTPGRTGAPMALAYCPIVGTVSVQVLFTCDHGTHEKIQCEACRS